MKKTILALTITALASTAHAGVVTTDGADIVIKTKGGGFSAKTTDDQYSFAIGGRAQLDYNSYDGVMNASTEDVADAGSSASDFFFRRARLEIKGHAGDWAYELAQNLGIDSIQSEIYSLSVTYTGFGDLFNIRVGKQKEDFGLDDTGSSNWTTAMERSLPSNAFDTGENNGIKLHGANDIFTYSVGVYKEGTDTENDLDTAVTGRVVVRPIYTEGTILHLGAGITQRKADESFTGYSARLGVRGGSDGEATKFSPEFTGSDGDADSIFNGDKSSANNLEAAFASGPVHVMAEYYKGKIDAPDVVAGSDDIEADGYYLQAAWILTGESRDYKTASGVFDKVKPASASGAWEVFARIEHLNVDQGTNIDLQGGEDADVLTLGVNWYATENVKVSLNYADADVDEDINGESDGKAVAARLQYAF